MTVPMTMRAVTIDRFGPPDVLHLADLPVPRPGRGEVLVRVHAAGVNAIDWLSRAGGLPVGQPAVLDRRGAAPSPRHRADRRRAGHRRCRHAVRRRALQPAVRRAAAKGALNSLFLGLGAVSLLVGAIGVGNVMLIGVLERRSEIGLRGALGATKGHISIQFRWSARWSRGKGGESWLTGGPRGGCTRRVGGAPA